MNNVHEVREITFPLSIQNVPSLTGRNVNHAHEVPHLCAIIWEGGHVRNQQAKAARNLKRPKLTTLWAAGLSFSKCHAERAVPYVAPRARGTSLSGMKR